MGASRPLPPAERGSFGAPARHGLTGAALPFFIGLEWWCLAPVQFSYLSNRWSEAHEAAIDVNPRLTGGGGIFGPSRFSAISLEVTRDSLLNFQYPPNYQFGTY